MQITINGEAGEFPGRLTIQGLLARLDLRTRRVAVERNLEIVPRSAYAATLLEDGDKVEVVHVVGGG